MATKNQKPHVDSQEQIEEVLSSSEKFIKENGKKMLVALVALIVCIGGYFAYNTLVKAPAEMNALNSSYVALQYFGEKDMEKALNGDDANMGLLEIASKYSSTEVGNSANHYVGICYLNMGEFEKAIEFFKKYNKVEGVAAEVVNVQNAGLTGDAYSELKDYSNALKYYKEAASVDNNFTAPTYLKKAGIVMIAQDDKAGAKKMFEQIKSQYSGSIEARDIDKLIAQCN